MEELKFIGTFLAFSIMFIIGFALFGFISISTILKNQEFIVEKLNKLEKKIDSLNEEIKPKN
jgi:hypothetical protein